MAKLIDIIRSWNWKVYAGAAMAAALAVLKQNHPDWQWVDYAMAALAAMGFAVMPTKTEKKQ